MVAPFELNTTCVTGCGESVWMGYMRLAPGPERGFGQTTELASGFARGSLVHVEHHELARVGATDAGQPVRGGGDARQPAGRPVVAANHFPRIGRPHPHDGC